MRQLTILTLMALALPALAAVPDERVDWLNSAAVPLETCEAGHGFADLAPLDDMIACAQIVGLGEATHGTREHFQMKHRLVEYLVAEHGFSIFAIEASTPEAHRLDAYVLGGDGDPRELIAGMYFWTWRTEEVLAMVEWMRDWNASHDHKVHFTGFDMQTPDVAAELVVDFLEEVDPERAGAVRERYEPMMEAKQKKSGIGLVSYSFPLEEARGKTIRFKGWIRTEDVKEGWGGLWWRVEGPDEKNLAYDNMASHGPRGTTDWQEYVIELPVDNEATVIYFGFIMRGHGRAWFDDATIEIDGEPWTDAFGLDFEGSLERAIQGSPAANYHVGLDETQPRTGGKCLRISRLPPYKEAMVAADAILQELLAARDGWQTDLPEAEIERALLNARIVAQCMKSRVGNAFVVRDRAMADNVIWLTEQHPDARIVLWAHNFHMARTQWAMGTHLDATFGPAYLPVGFGTAAGQYYAMNPKRSSRVHNLQMPPVNSFEAMFAAAEAPIFALDLREAVADSPASGWLLEERLFRRIGAIAMDEQFQPTDLGSAFDLMIFVEETTFARQLD